MQQADGAPDAVDDWRLIVANDDEMIWRVAWVGDIPSTAGERVYNQIEAQRELSAGVWNIDLALYRQTDDNTAFVNTRSIDLGEQPTREDAIERSVREMLDRGSPDNATPDAQWASYINPTPQFSGNQLTDF